MEINRQQNAMAMMTMFDLPLASASLLARFLFFVRLCALVLSLSFDYYYKAATTAAASGGWWRKRRPNITAVEMIATVSIALSCDYSSIILD